jgi:hypothetical protein
MPPKQSKQKNPVDTVDLSDQASRMRASGYIPATQIVDSGYCTSQTVAKWAADGLVESLIVTRCRYIKVSSLVAHIGERQAVIFGFVTEAELASRKKEKKL